MPDPHTYCLYIHRSLTSNTKHIHILPLHQMTDHEMSDIRRHGETHYCHWLMYIFYSLPCNYLTVRSIHLATCANPYTL